MRQAHSGRSSLVHDDLTTSEPVDVVRRLENLFFGEGGFSAERAVELIRDGARACGIGTLEAGKEADGWWVVAASEDWLPSESDARSFIELVQFPELGVNASRPEILLTAFAQSVVTARHGRVTVIVDRAGRAQEAAERFADQFARMARVIAFLP